MDPAATAVADRLLQMLALRGVTVVVASGDDGAAGMNARGNKTACGYDAGWPASSPYVSNTHSSTTHLHTITHKDINRDVRNLLQHTTDPTVP